MYQLGKAEFIVDLLRNKTRKVTLMFNPKLWEIFKKRAEKDKESPTQKIEKLIINHLEENQDI